MAEAAVEDMLDGLIPIGQGSDDGRVFATGFCQQVERRFCGEHLPGSFSATGENDHVNMVVGDQSLSAG